MHQSTTVSNRSPKSFEPNGISDLIEFQTRISALEKVIVKNINAFSRRESSEINIKPKSAKWETEESKSFEDQKRNKLERLRGKRYLTLDNLNLTKPKPEISEARKGVPIRDIQLDHASDGSLSANSRSISRKTYTRTDDIMIEKLQMARNIYETEKSSKKLPYEPQIEDLDPVHESKNGKLLNTLASDAEKLANLEKTVRDLTKRLETGKKSKKPKKLAGFDIETVKEQLAEAEETILQLVNVNVESKSAIEKNPGLAAWVEQDDSWKSSEKIERVRLEVQKIRYVLLKFEDETKTKSKSGFSRTKSRTSVILRDFIRRGKNKTKSGKSRRKRLCGCFTPASAKSERIKM